MNERRVAMVTGGGGGIGSAICWGLSDVGFNVAVTDVDGNAARQVGDEIGTFGTEMDVTDSASIKQALGQIEIEVGGVDILVNCAGWDEFMPFTKTDDAFVAKVLSINLAGPMNLTRAVLPGMIDRKWGRLIHIASDAGRVGSSLEAVYSGAKGGLIAFSKTVAREMARNGITSNSVCPGPTDTPLLSKFTESGGDSGKIGEALTRAVPMKRIGIPEDIAPAVVFLASEGAGYITGQTLSVSGGLTMA
jgi:2-hydroxycyclohexanecarboxyl-CoA dehydrogenase